MTSLGIVWIALTLKRTVSPRTDRKSDVKIFDCPLRFKQIDAGEEYFSEDDCPRDVIEMVSPRERDGGAVPPRLPLLTPLSHSPTPTLGIPILTRARPSCLTIDRPPINFHSEAACA